SLFHRPCSTCFHVLSLYLLLLFFFFFFFFFSMIPRPPISTLFPYTTLFRSFNFIYDIPVFRSSQSRLVKTALGGWQVSGIVTMSSGLPINIGLSGNQSGNGLPAATNRANLTGSVSYPHTVGQWFDTTAFTAPAVGAFGTLGHNALRGPGRDNWNMSLFKSFLFSEARGSRLEFRAESFNTWNHTQFHDVSTNLGDSKFGQVTSAFEPRI